MESVSAWVAPVATTLAAVVVAANLGARVTGYGFIVFAIGSVAWMAVGWFTDQPNLLWQNAALLVINLVGVWRWLGLRARYDRAAQAAAEASG